MKTKITIKRYKSTGKWLETLEETSDLPCYEHTGMRLEMEDKYPSLRRENYVIIFKDDEGNMFNERLILNKN